MMLGGSMFGGISSVCLALLLPTLAPLHLVAGRALLPDSELLLARDNSPSCPAAENSLFTTPEGQQYELYCDLNFESQDLPAVVAESWENCIQACDDYQMSPNEGGGANCIGAVYGPGDPNGGNCWLKYQVTQTGSTSGNYAARRVQYTIGGSPVYTDFAAVAVATTKPVADQPTTAAPIQTVVVVSSQAPVTVFISQSTPSSANGPAITPASPAQAVSLAAQLSPAASSSTSANTPAPSGQSDSSISGLSGTLVPNLIPLITSSASSSPASSSPSTSSAGGGSGTTSSSNNGSSPVSRLAVAAKAGITIAAVMLAVGLLVLTVALVQRRRRGRVEVPAAANQVSTPDRRRRWFGHGLSELPGDSPYMTELDGAAISSTCRLTELDGRGPSRITSQASSVWVHMRSAFDDYEV